MTIRMWSMQSKGTLIF